MPSLIMPPASVIIPRSHRFCRPEAHQWHVPHEGMNETATWSPSATWVTLVPTSVTMPEPSWPPTTGNMDFTPIISSTSGVWLMSPVRRCSSEWHMPDQTIFTRTSRLPGGSISISSVFQGSLSPVHTAARVVVIGHPSLRSLRTARSHLSIAPPPGRGQPGEAGGKVSRACAVPRVFTDMAARVRNWGRWGPDDEIGTLNLIDEAARRRGAAAVMSGQGVRPRAAPLGGGGDPAGVRRGPGQPDPHHGPGQPARSTPTNPTGSASARTSSRLATQCATHWDALAHASYGGVIYNGYPASSGRRPTAPPAAASTGSAPWSAGASCSTWRVPSDATCSSRATPSRPATSTRRARWPGSSGAGRHRAGAHGPDGASRSGQRDLVAYTWPSPGLTIETAGWFHRHDVAAVATDTLRLRGVPEPARGCLPAGAPPAPGGDGPDPGPELGARCAGRRTAPPTGATRFLLDATPLPLTQGLGTPLNPVALK